MSAVARNTDYPCACGCGKARGYEPIAGFRRACADDLLFEIRTLQDQAPDVLGGLAAALQDAGAVKLSLAAIGALPFEPAQHDGGQQQGLTMQEWQRKRGRK